MDFNRRFERRNFGRKTREPRKLFDRDAARTSCENQRFNIHGRRERLAATPLNPLPTFTGPISNEVGVSSESWQKSKKKKRGRWSLVSRWLWRFAGILIEREQDGSEQARQLAVGRALEWRLGAAGVGTEEESANTEGEKRLTKERANGRCSVHR